MNWVNFIPLDVKVSVNPIIDFLWLKPWKARGVTFGNHIFIRHDYWPPSMKLIIHELKHVEQWKRDELLFPIKYVYYHFRYGYHKNPYEIEAKEAEEIIP